MEILLTNSLFFLYLLGALAIFNYGAFDKRQKIAIIYVCSYGMAFNSAIRCYKVTILLVFVLLMIREIKRNSNSFEFLFDFLNKI